MVQNCPYCYSEVHDSATVCRYCSRDFTLVKSLLREIADLKATGGSAQATAAKPAATHKRRKLSFALMLFLYFLLLTLSTCCLYVAYPHTVVKDLWIFPFQLVLIPCMPIVWQIVKKAEQPNFWLLMVYSALPYLAFYYVYQSLCAKYEQYVNMYLMKALIATAVINTIATAIVGCVCYRRHNGNLKSFLSGEYAFKHFAVAQDRGERIEKAVSILGTVATIVYAIFNKL